MKKKQSLKKLNEFITEADSLILDVPLNSEKINIWSDEVFKAITYIFPESNDYRIDFSMAGDNPYILDDKITDKESNHILELSIIGKRNVIKNMIKEIENYWENEITSYSENKEEKKMKNIFISHISEEKEVSKTLKNLIEEIFPNQIEIFVSSDQSSLVAGEKWLDQISNALKEADLLIALCSEVSISRPWINFEIGSAWIKDIPIIPICHTGMTKNKLPQPVAMLQSMDLADEESLKYLFEGISKHLKLHLGKRIDYKSMIDEVNVSLGKVAVKEVQKSQKIVNEKEDLEDIELDVLKAFINLPHFIRVETILSKIKTEKIKLEYYLKELCDKKYLSPSYRIGSPVTYSLAQKGKGYLIKNSYI